MEDQMTQIDYQTATQFLPFKSQRGGLISFGIIFIIIGLFLLLGALALPLALVVSPQQSVKWQALLPLELIYLFAAGVCIFAGIENIRARKWVRPVGIVCGGIGLLAGIIGTIAVAVQWNQMITATLQSGGINTAAANVGMAIGMGVAALFYIVLPALVFWFYRRPDVLHTVRYFDRSPSWTDGKPLSLIAAIIVELAMAMSMPVMLMYGVFPLFTLLIHGAAASVLYLALSAAHLLAAFLLLKRRDEGIWLALGLPIFQMVSTATALARYGYDTVFRQPDFFVQPGTTPFRPPPPNMTMIYVIWGIMLIAWCLFLLFTRRRLMLVIPPPAGEGATV
jgi:hypothetical protein